MNVADLYRKIKQIFNDSNVALIGKGLNEVSSLSDISSEIEKLEINRLPYLLRKEIIEVEENDLEGHTAIGDFAFYYCDNLTNVMIPEGITKIGWSAFDNCRSLANIIIPNSVIEIATYAFYDCTALTDIIIPSGVKSIGGDAFRDCVNLADMYLHPASPPTLNNIGAYNSSIPSITTIHVPVGSGEAYRTATNWSTFADQIVEDIEV